MTKLTKNMFRQWGILLLVFLIPLSLEAQKPSRKVSKAQKKSEKVLVQQKKAYQKARKSEVKRRYNMQTPETKAQMKQTRKEARKHNKVKKDPLFRRLFKKHKAKRHKPNRKK